MEHEGEKSSKHAHNLLISRQHVPTLHNSRIPWTNTARQKSVASARWFCHEGFDLPHHDSDLPLKAYDLQKLDLDSEFFACMQ